MQRAATENKTDFASEGFDLDAVASNDSDVILELGGGVSRVGGSDQDRSSSSPPSTNEKKEEKNNDNEKNDLMSEAEDFKARGNASFSQRRYEEAIELYTSAIEAMPGQPTGEELIFMEKAWRDEQDKAWRQKLAQLDQERRDEAKKQRERGREEKQGSGTSQHPSSSSSSSPSPSLHAPPERPKEAFVPPSKHPHAETLAVYHGNRAAAFLQIQQYEEAVRDCDRALLLNPSYLKALARRSTANEKLEKTDLALADVKAALSLDPANRELRQRRDRLQKLEDERLEKLKAETMDKLKDLGNSILGNFGLSLDNFKATQDPNTGSYSISFQQNK